MAEHSTPMIEMLLRQQIQDDTSIAVDTVLVDNNVATTVRPPGLRSYGAGLTPTAGGGFNALVADIKQLISALAAVNSMRRLTWLMHPSQKVSINFTQSSLGTFPFAAEIEQNTLAGYPVIVSSTMPLGTVILVDAADFVSLSGDDPRFEVSDQATLHMEDTTPLAIGTPGTPPTVAAPVRSMFQTDSLALRMILPMNWIMRRPVISWVAAVTW
jgi:HK97 family phage major capsid protein